MQFYSSPLHKTNNKFVHNQFMLLYYEQQNKTRLKLLHAQDRGTAGKPDHLTFCFKIQGTIKQSGNRKYIFITYFYFSSESYHLKSSLFHQQW